MKQMKTLTVNGVTYAVTDPTAPRIDDTVLGDAPWSAKKIVDTLCPAFTKTGAIVTCTPVEGYPLAVQADSTVTRCGKNLLDLSEKQIGLVPVPGATTVREYWGTVLQLQPGTYTIHAEQKEAPPEEQYLYGALATVDNGFIRSFHSVVGTRTETRTAVLEEPCLLYVYAGAWADPQSAGIYKSKAMESFGYYHIQLELGDAATVFEEYAGETFAAGETVPALAGINTLWAEKGTVTVTGRADPTYAVLETGGGTDGV